LKREREHPSNLKYPWPPDSSTADRDFPAKYFPSKSQEGGWTSGKGVRAGAGAGAEAGAWAGAGAGEGGGLILPGEDS